ncbi:Tc toxin subunit A-related protein [Taibaiella soli]|uniref:Virulence plasmid A protein n=1 Tax=Taibaiella soli TaxID=1649169 RepID=A0A2W2BKB7_9BACT|nr:neuraminidase-like domain-containing protein [Taibaiella soli]PZF73906.1 hypothetical protein DN068_06070 [Taibaiella soli]
MSTPISFVQAPFLIGQQGPEVQNLQNILLQFVSQGSLTAPLTLTDQVNTEMVAATLGTATAQLIKFFIAQNHIVPGSDLLVDDIVAKAINVMVNAQSLLSLKYTVSGYVALDNVNYNPTITLYQVFLRNKNAIATAPIDETGFYYISYDSSLLDTTATPNVALQVAVHTGAGDTQKEFPSDVLYKASGNDQINLGANATNTAYIEYSEIANAVAAVAPNIQFHDINLAGDTEEVTHLSQQTGESEERISQFITANKIAVDLGVTADVIYALIRQNISVAYQPLLAQSNDTLISNLKIAMVNNTIVTMPDASITTSVSALKSAILRFLISDSSGDAAASTTYVSIKHVLNGDEDKTQSFLNAYYSYPNNSDMSVWDYVVSVDPTLTNYIDGLKSAFNLISMVGNNPAMVTSLYDQTAPPHVQLLDFSIQSLPVSGLSSLATLSKTDWVNTLSTAQTSNSSMFAIPATIAGNTVDEKISNYADTLQATFSIAYPTQSINAHITADDGTPFTALKTDLNTFSVQNASFDIRTVSTADLIDPNNTNYNFSGVTDRQAFSDEVGIVQRLMNVTTDNLVISALAQGGFHSSLQISQSPQESFVTQYAPVATTAGASAIYTKAQAVTTFNTAAIIDKFFNAYGKNIYALTDVAHPDWRSLFGTLDSCNCSQCTSVFSPAAYMTDTLRFLLNNVSKPIHDALINTRRPDIKDIELSCQNTNTSVPQIDMVNEMLEDMIGTGQYKFFARQTVADAATQRIIPEYVNTAGVTFGTTYVASPYPKLSIAKYPQTLPYNFYKRQIDTHLAIAGVKGHELVQRFGGLDSIHVFSGNQFCNEYLGLTNEQANIITTAPALTGTVTDLMEAYGLKPLTGSGPRPIPDPAKKGAYLYPNNSTWTDVLGGRVDVFLQQSGLAYTDLLQLLDCYMINPATYSGSTVTRKIQIAAISGANLGTCDLSQLQITGLDASVLAILYRFVRAAKALGWTYYELDRAMRVLCPAATGTPGNIDSNALTMMVQVKRVTELLKCTVEEACMFWTNTVDTLPYRDYTTSEPKDIPSQYQRLFCNNLLTNIKADDYPFNNDGTIGTSQDAVLKYLAGAVGMSSSDILLLASAIPNVAHPIAITSLAGISTLYTCGLLIKKLGMTVTDWLTFRQWLSGTNFVGTGSITNYFGNITSLPSFGNPMDTTQTTLQAPFSNPLTTIQYIAFARLLKDARFSLADVEYLLRDNIADTIADDTVQNSLVNTLTSYRAALAKKMYPDYDKTEDTGSIILQDILASVTDAGNAQLLITAIEDTTDPFSADVKTLITGDLNFLIPSESDLENAPTTIARRDYLFNCLTTYISETILKPAAVSFFAKEFKISEDCAQVLFDSCVGFDSGTSAYDILLNATFLRGSDTIVRWDANHAFDNQFKIVLQLHKASIMINKFGLGKNDIVRLWANPNIAATETPLAIPSIPVLSKLPVRTAQTTLPTVADASFITVLNLIYWMHVRAFLGDGAYVLFDGLAARFSPVPPPTGPSINPLSAQPLPDPTVDKQKAIAAIVKAFKTNHDDITALLGGLASDNGLLQIAFSIDTYWSPLTYLRIIDCLEMQSLLPASMKTLGAATSSVLTADTQSTASVVMQLVKSQYNDNDWLNVIKPVNDMLRIERRDAMVAYLLAYPVSGYESKWLTDNDIYETIMVDVEMTPCMPTTRILLAINTIQLFIERILLGLEPSYAMDKDDTRQWNTWRKLYRVWEANRKIFLYPENWIEPELRDDKSPFFLELEKNLKQNDVTADVVETAYATYLERLDEVAHLDIVGLYQEKTPSNTDVVHVFGRTKSAPHIYYYRKYATNMWTAWEKMNVQIDSEHFVPVVWRNRLRFYWLVFTKDVIQQTATNIRSNEPFVKPDDVRWKVDLAWTEYKNGTWTAQQIGKQSWYSNTITEEDPVSWAHVEYFGAFFDKYPRGWFLAGSLDRVKKDRLHFYCNIDNDGQLKFNVNELVVSRSGQSLHDTLINIAYPPDGTISHKNISGNITKIKVQTLGDKEFTSALKQLKSMTDNQALAGNYLDVYGLNGSFTVKFNGVLASQINTPAQCIYYGFDNAKGLLRNGYQIDGTSYNYTNSGYNHYPNGNTPLLTGTPNWTTDPIGNKSLVFPRIVPQGYTEGTAINIPYFFYKDFKNTFFVEKITKALTGVISDNTESTDFITPTKTPFTGRGTFTVGRPNGGFQTGYDANAWQTTPVSFTDGNIYATSYRFHNFHHDNVDDFMETFSAGGVDALLDKIFISGILDTINFKSKYSPTSNVDTNYPVNNVDFSSDGAYAGYNWELFYHIPMLIANKLCQNQQFEDARTWYQYVFNPTAATPHSVTDFWNFQPFVDIATQTPSIADIMGDTNLQKAVDNWANDPFKPHLVARTRPSAYMKNTVMKYLDNLIAWGDNLFSTDTRENINEATLLYVLAAQLLGRRPDKIPARAKSKLYTYATLSTDGTFNAFAEALVKIESVMQASGTTGTGVPSSTSSQLSNDSMYYFCLPSNDMMDQYWDTIADRLFKIRNCQNIDGVERELALFDPPIDPALLVKAAASGLNLADVISGINAPLPNYRFNVLSQKATELAQEVKGLGSQLLSALEKKDAESLALLRSSQEMSVLDAVTELKEKQVDEAGAQIDALNTQLSSATQRRDYYSQLIDGGLSGQEELQLGSIGATIPITLVTGGIQALAAGLQLVPEFTLGAFSAGAQTGGSKFSESSAKGAAAQKALAEITGTIGTMAGINAGYKRRAADWSLQLKVAEKEITQLNQQIIAAQIRQAMASVELRNHQLQLQNAKDMDVAMREKYTNEDLYDWMIGQISFSYFQAYKLACDIAKRAERCYQYELGIEGTGFIQAGYWDNLKKGLLAGEQLIYDIKRMETSYLEKNKRQLELTKHVSLAMFAPDQLIDLKSGKSCSIDLQEWLFDMDYPGHYMRRIKSVSISIPCVAGPYTTVSCKLSQTKSKYRKNATLVNEQYEEATSDLRFATQYGNIQSIATSSAQNDAGMFEFSFRDERYLPFEGTGAISTWNIELPAVYAQFDYDSISDVILHIKYTALDSGSTLKKLATESVQKLVASLANPVIPRLFDMKREFNTAWNSYVNNNGTETMSFSVGHNMFPYFCEENDITVANLSFGFTAKDAASASYKIQLFYIDKTTTPNETKYIEVGLNPDTPGYFTTAPDLKVTLPGAIIGMRLVDSQDKAVNMDTVANDLYLILNYTIGEDTSGTGGGPSGISHWIISKDFIVS